VSWSRTWSCKTDLKKTDSVNINHLHCLKRLKMTTFLLSVIYLLSVLWVSNLLFSVFLRPCRRLGYCGNDISTVAEMFDEADETLFHRILANNNHVLQSYLPDRSCSQYNLRTGAHSKELIIKTSQLKYACCTKDVTERKAL